MKLYYPGFSSGEIIQAPTGNGKTINTVKLLLEKQLQALQENSPEEHQKVEPPESQRLNYAVHKTASYQANQRVRQTSRPELRTHCRSVEARLSNQAESDDDHARMVTCIASAPRLPRHASVASEEALRHFGEVSGLLDSKEHHEYRTNRVRD